MALISEQCVETGDQVIIERYAVLIAVLRSATPPRRTTSECIAVLPDDSTAVIDPDYGKDVEAAKAAHREPLEPSASPCLSAANSSCEVFRLMHPLKAAFTLGASDLDGQSQAKGIRIPLSDRIIGVTALELGYRIATHNIRHFQLIPNLDIVKL